jgi:23S rRNA pseudouridine1911/1915/1917 synthase
MGYNVVMQRKHPPKPSDQLPDEEHHATSPPLADGEGESVELSPEDLSEREFHITHDLVKRLDLYLKDRLPHHSRASLQKLIKAGMAKVNGRIARASTVLRAGDIVCVQMPPVSSHEAQPEPIPLTIIYEDDHFIAINKQRGLLVHPARGNWTGTMINALLHHSQRTAGTLSTGSDPWRPGIIHRLDRDTTGIILVAKTDEAHWRLAGQFERRTIRKTYLAIVHGQPALDSDLIDAPIGLHPKNRERMAVRKDIGRPAQTVYSVVERLNNFSLVELAPKTGRTHQLRVHMAFIGHPIVGDVDYGGKIMHLSDLCPGRDSTILLDRQALHAYRLQFVHPVEYHRMLLEAPPPADFAEFLALLRTVGR